MYAQKVEQVYTCPPPCSYPSEIGAAMELMYMFKEKSKAAHVPFCFMTRDVQKVHAT